MSRYRNLMIWRSIYRRVGTPRRTYQDHQDMHADVFLGIYPKGGYQRIYILRRTFVVHVFREDILGLRICPKGRILGPKDQILDPRIIRSGPQDRIPGPIPGPYTPGSQDLEDMGSEMGWYICIVTHARAREGRIRVRWKTKVVNIGVNPEYWPFWGYFLTLEPCPYT